MSTVKKPNLLVIGNPVLNKSSEAFIEKFIQILHPLANNIHIISGDKPPLFTNSHWYEFHYRNDTFYQKVLGIIYSQIYITLKTIYLSKYYDTIIILPSSMAMPLIISKLLKKRTVIFMAQKIPNYMLLKLFGKLSLHYSDLIIVESMNVVNDLQIYKYKYKVVRGNIFVDTCFFKIDKNINSRQKIVGYIGGLEKRKGIENLISAIETIEKINSDIEFIIGGSGRYIKNVETIKSNHVNFVGLIPQKDLPKYLNSIKLLVLPSYTEGVPNIILEAMACGTPVLATKVGGIVDLIKDKETGFLLEKNSPESIAREILEVIEFQNMDLITKKALDMINKEFSYESAVSRYKNILLKEDLI